MSKAQASFPWKVDLRLPQPAHEQIYRQARAAILSGVWPPGTVLPPVREAAAALGVHFNTVARAYRRLAREGWVVSRPGRGTVVQAPARAAHWQAEALDDLARRYVTQARWLGFGPAEMLAAVQRALDQTAPAEPPQDAAGEPSTSAAGGES